MLPMAGTLSSVRSLVIPDLPGHGETEINATTPEQVANSLHGLVTALGFDAVDIVCVGTSSVYASALLQQAPDRVGRVIFCNPWLAENSSIPSENGALPDLASDSAGSHLQRAWYYLRDRALSTPWNCREKESVQFDSQVPLAHHLQGQLIALLKARKGLADKFAAAASHLLPINQQTGEVDNILVAATASNCCRAHLPEANLLPDEINRWGTVILAMLQKD